jgi:NADPH:quinone reductase
MASGVYLTFFASFVFGKPGFPLSDISLQAIAADVEAGRYGANLGAVRSQRQTAAVVVAIAVRDAL